MSCICHLDLSSFIQSFTQMFIQMYNRYIQAENSAKYMLSDGFFGIQLFVKIQFRPGLHPRPCWGSLQRSPRPLSWLGRGKEDFPSPFLTHSMPLASRLSSRCPRHRACHDGQRLLTPPLAAKSWRRAWVVTFLSVTVRDKNKISRRPNRPPLSQRVKLQTKTDQKVQCMGGLKLIFVDGANFQI